MRHPMPRQTRGKAQLGPTQLRWMVHRHIDGTPPLLQHLWKSNRGRTSEQHRALQPQVHHNPSLQPNRCNTKGSKQTHHSHQGNPNIRPNNRCSVKTSRRTIHKNSRGEETSRSRSQHSPSSKGGSTTSKGALQRADCRIADYCIAADC